ncbi:MAG: tetratricopeptide repeat protein [Pseudomonadota bacterium]
MTLYRRFVVFLGVLIVSLGPVTVYADKQQSEDETNFDQSRFSEKISGRDKAYGAYQRGMYLTAFNLALPRAQEGDAAAQTLIAELYEQGLGIKRDTGKAAEWYEIAANSGNREAKFALAVKLLAGKDLTPDKERGFDLMKQAAEAGHPLAMYNHANHIISRRPTGAGYRQALPFLEKAAEYRNGDAYYALSQIYREGLTDGIQRPDVAREWLIRAAKAGVDTAQIDLALDLVSGRDGPKDEKKAYDWFSLAAGRGNVIAQNRLAHMLARGLGVEADPLEAAKWHIIAQRAGRRDLELDLFFKSLEPDMRKKAIELANRWPTTIGSLQR